MTALAKLFRTTAFKLALALLTIFVATAMLALAYVVWQSNRLIAEQMAESVNTELAAMAEEYRVGGLRGLATEIQERARQPGSLVYLLTAPNGQPLAGNVGALPPGLLDRAGTREIVYERLGNGDEARGRAHVSVVILPGSFRLLVGRDLAERSRFADVLTRTFLGGLLIVVLLGLGGGVLVSHRVLMRLDDMTDTSRRIMAGDLSGRLPVVGSDDEFDRLATATNQMLDRIGELMTELRQVTDNVAHDLKTPLTRLRNRAEEALRGGHDEAGYRCALEQVIEESDGLIGTFNTMLVIARAESGAVRDQLMPLDVSELMEGVAELYEPVAEEAGVRLRVSPVPATTVLGNREMLGQALANLLDNALKYGAAGDSAEVTIAVESAPQAVRLVVADRGPGIAEEDRTRAMERFVRLEASRSRPGSGLGLSLAFAIARLHGGSLRLEDHRPGLRAVMELPRHRDRLAEPAKGG